MFTKKQIKLMKWIGLNLAYDKELSDNNYIVIEREISHLLQPQGIDKKYQATEIDKIYE